MSPKAPRPGDFDPHQGVLFEDPSRIGRMAISEPIVPTEGTEGFPVAPEDPTRPAESPDNLIPPDIAKEIVLLKARHQTLDHLARENKLSGQVFDKEGRIRRLHRKHRTIPEGDQGLKQRHDLSAQIAKIEEAKDVAVQSRNQKFRDARLSFATSIGIEAEVKTVQKTDSVGDLVTDSKGEPEMVERVMTTDPTQMKELEKQFKAFWDVYGGQGTKKKQARNEERQRIKDEIQDKLAKARSRAAVHTDIAPDLLNRVQAGLKKTR